MTGVVPIVPFALLPQAAPLPVHVPLARAPQASFADLLAAGVDGVSTKVGHADAMVRAFALDDSVPVHQVTLALEQARLSLELMLQVRSRLIEAYQQLSNMQL